MEETSLIELLEAEWSYPDGFLAKLRSGDFSAEGFRRFRQLLDSIQRSGTPEIDRRLVELLWFIPMFMMWQRERVGECGGDPREVETAANEVTGILLEGALGAP
jgi:hypothetical protein